MRTGSSLKYLRSLLIGVCSLAVNDCVAADTVETEAGPYIGIFGGVGSSPSTSLRQQGAVYLNPPNSFPMLPIDANGSTDGSNGIPVAGAHIGYEWDHWEIAPGWGLKPALELEGIYIGEHSPVGTMPVHPSFLGTQYVTVPITTGVVLPNAVLVLQTPYSDKIFPYFGLGAGGAFVSISGSDSANPSEPGINHFNSAPDASDFAFAWQLKAGIKAEIFKNTYLFLEYRYLSIDPTSYTFGSTDYPGVHLPTTSWNVNLGRQEYNLFITGLQYKF
ncbi:MAG: outer membrane beta-barrel protein [Verrucomicrobiota bacterium JB024]|nr:outer membrane beta-barrel protein [Verrucomicrobiota bacterium JB024]